MVYKIYEEFFPNVEKILNRIGKKCRKLGNDFSFQIVGTETKEFSDSGITFYKKFFLIEVSGIAIINGWKPVAILDCFPNGNVIRKIDSDIEIPKHFYNSENKCDHCNSKRNNRKNLFVVYNKTTNEWKQVGKDCLKLYTGGLNAESVVSYLDGLTELEKYNGIEASGNKVYYDINTVIMYAYNIIKKIGYYNSSCDISTKLLVSNVLFNKRDKAIKYVNKELKDGKFNVDLNKDDIYADNADVVHDIIEYYKSLDDNNEFIHNVKVLLNEGYTDSKGIGYLCYLPQGYITHKEKENEKFSEYFGEVGKRYKDIKISFVDVIASWNNQFGRTTVYKFIVEDGNVLVWKTTTQIEEGNYSTISFTVKQHKEYKGVKQTEINRVRIK